MGDNHCPQAALLTGEKPPVFTCVAGTVLFPDAKLGNPVPAFVE